MHRIKQTLCIALHCIALHCLSDIDSISIFSGGMLSIHGGRGASPITSSLGECKCGDAGRSQILRKQSSGINTLGRGEKSEVYLAIKLPKVTQQAINFFRLLSYHCPFKIIFESRNVLSKLNIN